MKYSVRDLDDFHFLSLHRLRTFHSVLTTDIDGGREQQEHIHLIAFLVKIPKLLFSVIDQKSLILYTTPFLLVADNEALWIEKFHYTD